MLAILGAGGHGRVVADAYDGEYQFFDDGENEYPSLDEAFVSDCDCFIVAVGDNKTRRDIYERFFEVAISGGHLSPIIVAHPLSTFPPFVTFGTYIGANAYVSPSAYVSDNCIINTGAIIEHDCKIFAHTHIAPGAVLCGGVTVWEGALVGANATVLPNQNVPSWSTVRAGSLYYENPHEQSGHQ